MEDCGIETYGQVEEDGIEACWYHSSYYIFLFNFVVIVSVRTGYTHFFHSIIVLITFFRSTLLLSSLLELARRNYNSITTLEEEENRRVVEQLYVALGSGDSETVGRILAADLEWWFHGPPSCDHMMRLLTGASGHKHFSFNPKSITAAGNKVFVEGHENESAYWVHVWTLKDNIVTQLREFFNTSLVAREFTPHSSSLPRREMVACNLLVWESEIPISQGNSMPGLVLAI
ncbi:uncharacterized protein LOC131067573 [Cryptomeria japonica]|uniref:uncharacterized protein LOC131067573 n=1 Tax=Cryptomeria japonica TaxID=3369 RepID=UPI0027DA4FD3|nr:uncharacterized protein LOC131067573 [Cryptomeria japonica]